MMIKHYLKVAFRNFLKYKTEFYIHYRTGSRIAML